MSRFKKPFLFKASFAATFAASLFLLACSTSQADSKHASVATHAQPQKISIPKGAPISNLDPRSVLLISIDGLRPDYLSQTASPNIFNLGLSGVQGDGMTPSYPSLTFPNHFTLVTGLRPAKHGIVANEIKDPNMPERFNLGRRDIISDPRWWLGEPVWVTAQKQGLKSGTMYWPGSETEIMGVRPTYYLPYDQTKPREDRVAQVLEWLDLPQSSRPQFLTLYFEDVDTAGHKFGPKSAEVAAAVVDVDNAIGLLVQGLKDRNIFDKLNIILVSDHGMAPVLEDKRINVADILKEFPEAESIGSGALMGVFAKDPDLQKRIVKRFNDFNSILYKAYLKADLPARFHYNDSPRIPDVLIVANESAYLQTQASPGHSTGGTHGYDNLLLSMRASFIAHGPAFREGIKFGVFDNIQLYSLLCRILNINPSPNDGSLSGLESMLRKGAKK